MSKFLMLQYSKQVGKSNVYKVEAHEPKRLEKAITELAEEGFRVESIVFYPQIMMGTAHKCYMAYIVTESA